MSLSRLVRENPWTTAMLAFSSLLLGVVLLVSLSSEAPRTHRLEKTSGFDRQALEEKERIVQRKLEEDPVLAASLSLGVLALFAAGAVIDIVLLRRAFTGRPWFAPKPLGTDACWGKKQLLQGAVFLFFAEGCLFLLHAGFFFWTHIELSEDLLLLLTSLGRDLLVAGFILVVIRKAGGRPLRDLGLSTKDLLSQVRVGVLAYLAMLPVLALSLMALAAVASFFAYEPEPQNVVQMYLKPEMGPYLVGFTVFVAALGPVLEEMFFRGFFFGGLRKGLGFWKAALVTAFAFAAFHMSVIAFFPVLLLGLFLCFLYERTGSLVPSISAHVLHNTLMVGLTLGFRTLAGS